jgi:ABC-type nitrate/sulfonate/bicarbonate transport system substrate-binding protein
MRCPAVVVAALIVLMVGCGPSGAPAPAAPKAAPVPTAAQAPAGVGSGGAGATPAPQSGGAAALPVKYAFAPRLPMIPVFVAEEKGFFAEQGLDVEFVPFAGGSNEMLPL